MIEMPDSVWQGMNANCDEMTIALSNLQTSMDCQMPEVKFLREVAHAMARLTTLVGRQKKYIKDCYLGNVLMDSAIDPLAGVKHMKTAMDMVFGAMGKPSPEASDMDEEDAFPEEHDGEKRQACAEAYGEDR